MRTQLPFDSKWPEPWRPITDEKIASLLLAELMRETSPHHCLFQRPLTAVGRRDDCDDVLFLTNDPARPIVVVHLTWKGQTEPDPEWPATEFFSGWDDWLRDQFEACVRYSQAKRYPGATVVFRSAKERPFAERKATITRRIANR